MSTMGKPDGLWPLNECCQIIKQISHSIPDDKQASQVYTAALGLLCHLKKEQSLLFSKSENEDEPIPDLPAMSAVISDASIFQALLRCLRAPPPSSEDTKGPAARRIGKANLGHNRKRSLSVSEDKTKSPMPAGKNYVGASSDKVTMPVSVVAATIFYVGLQHLDHWPAPLVHAYAEDAFGQRLWVDREECKPLVENLALVLEKHASPDNKEGLVVPFYAELMARSSPESNGSTPNSPKATPQQVMRSLSEGGATGAEIPFPDDDSDSGEEEIVEVSTGTLLSQASSNKSKQSNGDDSSSSGDEEVVTSSNPVPSLPAVPSAPQKPPVNRYPAMPSKIDLTRIRPRYFGVNQNAAFGAIEKAMEERLEVKSKQNSRLLQSLPAFCVVPGVRKLAAQNLAKWLQSPALSGGARTLFTSIVNQLQNIDPPLPEDLGAVDAILEMQLKANQLNMHIENVTRIAKRIPTASISRHMFLKLLRIELSGMDDSNQSTEHMQMISTVNTALDSSSLSNDGIAAALLTLLASPNKKLTRPERDSLVRKLRMLLRRIASNLGNSFDGCGLLESLLSFDVDAASWTARDEEDRGRMLVECVSLLVPKPTNQADVPVGRGKNARKQFVPKLENGFTVDEIKALSVKLRRARKLLISWACSDYSPLWQSENSNKTSFSGNSRKGKQEEPIGAGAPNFTSVLDNNSMLKDKSSCPDAVKCALFMIDPESDTMREFLFPEGVPENMDLSKSDELFRIKQCHRYGTDLDDEMLKIIVGSAQEDGIGMHSALSLMEHLFECCKKGRKASLYLTDASIVWEMYKLVEYTPEHIPEPPPDEKEEVDEDDQFADADDDQFADADEMEIDQPQTNGSTNKENGSKTEVPRLAHPGMWWRVTTLALVMSGASPGGIGATLCENHPTVQALVKMVTSGRYRFPTVDCDDTSREQMKKGENALRDEESKIAELLFIPPLPKEKKKKDDKPFGHVGSRTSARQRTRYDRMLKEKREKEAAAALAFANKRKKTLKAAQKTIMLWDPKSAARKPPKESVNLILSVEKLFGLSNIFQECTAPDLVLAAIGDTTRGAIERAYDWLIPVISAMPSIISRLPASASCFLLLRAYGTEGERNSELRELSAPLLDHVQKTVTGKFGEDDAKRAANILFSDIADKKPERRRCARRVLQQALAEINQKVEDRSFDSANCTWLLSLLLVEHAEALVADAIDHISNAMAYERGQVLRALLFSLRLYIDFAASKKIKGSWDFPSLLCELISERHNVWSATMVKFSDLRILATTVIYDHFQSFLSEKPVPNGKEDIVRITPCQVNANSTQDEIFLPLSLLQSTCVLLSIWKESSDENKDDKSKGVIGFLADLLMLPSVEEMDELDVDGMDGVASATMVATEKRAVAVEQWVMLAKARSDFVARRAALSAPAKFLPRLLLCSGLPKSSLLTMIDRLGQLGENSDKEDSRVFRDLLLPSSTSDWGFGHLGTRRDIARKLIGRLSSYISLNGESIESLSSNVSLTFLNWLSEECKPPENPKKIKLKKARRSTESFKLSEATSILSLKSGDEDEEDTDSSDDIESIERIGFKMGSQREKVSIEHVNNENIESFVKTCHGRSEINTMELLMERRFFVPGSVTEKRRKKRKRPNTTSEKGSIDRLELSSAIMITQDSNLEWKRARSVWIPAITKSEGSPIFWTQLFSQEMENGDVDSLLPQCILGWSTKHITSCKVWIFSLKDEQLTELCMPKVVEFLLVSCGQAATQTRNFRNNAVTMGGWMSNKASVDDIARIVFAAAKSSDVQVDNRNHLPCWIQLILLVSQAGKHQANHLVITLLTLLDKDKANEDLRMRVAVAVLRVYASFPYFVNLGNAKLRSVLLTASNSADWIPWRTPIDAPIGNILEALKSNHSQRLVQGLVDYAKSHPLILLRRLDLMAAVLKEDAGNTQPLRSAGRVRVYGESFSGAATALINGSKMKVIIRHWGYSYSDPLWVSLIEVLLSVPREVLFTCGLGMGLENFLGVYAKMLYIQSQLQNRDKTARLKSRFSDLLKIFEKHEGWNGWLSSKLDGLESLGSMRNVLVSVSLISTDQAMANIRSNKVQT